MLQNRRTLPPPQSPCRRTIVSILLLPILYYYYFMLCYYSMARVIHISDMEYITLSTIKHTRIYMCVMLCVLGLPLLWRERFVWSFFSLDSCIYITWKYRSVSPGRLYFECQYRNKYYFWTETASDGNITCTTTSLSASFLCVSFNVYETWKLQVQRAANSVPISCSCHIIINVNTIAKFRIN